MDYGMGRCFIRGGVWWTALMVPDPKNQGATIEKRESTRCPQYPTGIREKRPDPKRPGRFLPPKEVKDLLAERRAAAGRGELVSPDKLTFDRIASDCEAKYKRRITAAKTDNQKELALANYDKCRLALARLRKKFSGWLVRNITFSALDEYIVNEKVNGISSNGKIGRSSGGIILDMVFLKQAFKLAVDNNLLTKVPSLPEVGDKDEGARSGVIPDDTFVSIVNAIVPAHHQAPFWFLRYVGVRSNEGRRLTWPNINFTTKEIVFHREMKTRDNKRVRRAFSFLMLPELEALLLEQRTLVDRLQVKLRVVIPWVFPNNKGKMIQRCALYSAWKRARAKVGAGSVVQMDGSVRNAMPHDLRRTVLTDLASIAPGGLGVRVARQTAGHHNPQTTENYIYCSREQQDAVMADYAAKVPQRKVVPFEVRETA